MPIDHSACTHPRTPKGRAACRRAGNVAPSQRPVETTKERRPSDDTRTTRRRAGADLRALADAPARVRVFIERCRELGLEITEAPVEVGHSLEVYSSRGAGRVTWEGERVAWFTRVGWSSVTRRVTSQVEVCSKLGIAFDED